MRYDAILEADELLAGRPFTDPRNSEREGGVMQQMLVRQRGRVRRWLDAEGGRPEDGLVARESDGEGHRALLVVPQAGTLLDAEDLTAVGFFARPRDDVDHGILFDLEDELVSRMREYVGSGLLSYFDVELVKGAYGNLILFSTPDVPPAWHRDPVHRRAVELSPGHYHEVRLHKGSVPGRFFGDGTITLERTKYFDFDVPSPWLGLRRFAAA